METQDRYFVWVGGTYNMYTDPIEALIEKNRWLEAGYTDVQVTIN
jgi:hypothetical protein